MKQKKVFTSSYVTLRKRSKKKCWSQYVNDVAIVQVIVGVKVGYSHTTGRQSLNKWYLYGSEKNTSLSCHSYACLLGVHIFI